MADQLLNTNMVTREILRALRQKLTFLGKVNREYDDSFAVSGAKIGSTVNVRVPQRGKVRHGRIMDANTPNDRTRPLTITDQDGVDLAYSSADFALSIDEFRKRYIDTPVGDLATDIESRVMQRALAQTYSQVGDPTTPLSFAKALVGKKVMTDNLAPIDGRMLLTNSAGAIQAVNDTKLLFNSQRQVADQYEDGSMGRAAGFDWYESTIAPVFTNGAGTGYVTNGVPAEGSSTLPVDTGTGALTAGTVLTIAGVLKVHAQTKTSLGELAQFVVTEDYAGGAGNVSISPALNAAGPQKNVTALPADGAAVTVVGGAGVTYGVNLGFQRDFLTFATVDLPLPPNKDASRMTFDGLSLRMISDYDTVNDLFLHRVDILWGAAVLRPELGLRIANDVTELPVV
jgi:hypothetical protein